MRDAPSSSALLRCRMQADAQKLKEGAREASTLPRDLAGPNTKSHLPVPPLVPVGLLDRPFLDRDGAVDEIAGEVRGEIPLAGAASSPGLSTTLQSGPRHMTPSSASRIGLLTLLILGAPTVTHGQTRTQATRGCDAYDSCALRVQHHLFSNKIVRGTDDTEVARIGFRTPALQGLFARSDRAAISFDLFREDHVRSSWLGLLGGIGFVGGLVAGARGNKDWAAGLSISGTLFSVGSGIFRTKANEHLSKAIWLYNVSLSDRSAR